MTGTDVARFTHKSSRSYLNHLVYSIVECTTEVVEMLRCVSEPFYANTYG